MSMNPLLLVVGTPAGGPIPPIDRTFGVDWLHLVSQLISFAIVCALLYKFAYRRVLLILARRRQRIVDELAKARAIEAELHLIESQRQEVLDKANVQARQLIGEARKAAEREHKLETQKAITSAGQIIAKAREEAGQHHSRMLAAIKAEVARRVLQITENVTGRILTLEDQRRLTEDTANVISGAQTKSP